MTASTNVSEWPVERIVSELRRWVADNGELPSASRWRIVATRDASVPSAYTATRVLGSWSDARRATGSAPLRERKDNKRARWDRSNMIVAARAWAAVRGSLPTSTAWTTSPSQPNRLRHPTYMTVLKTFSSWAEFLDAVRQSIDEDARGAAEPSVAPVVPVCDATLPDEPLQPIRPIARSDDGVARPVADSRVDLFVDLERLARTRRDERLGLIDIERLVELGRERLERAGLRLGRTYLYDATQSGLHDDVHRTAAAVPAVRVFVTEFDEHHSARAIDAQMTLDILDSVEHGRMDGVCLLGIGASMAPVVKRIARAGIDIVVAGDASLSCNKIGRHADRVVRIDLLELPARAEPARTREPDDIVIAAHAFGAQLLAVLDASERAMLDQHHPRVPPAIDQRLLIWTEDETGVSMRDDELSRRRARIAFWEYVRGQSSPEARTG